jgi:hypothetical protein
MAPTMPDSSIVFTLRRRNGARHYALIRTASDWLPHLTKEQSTEPG